MAKKRADLGVPTNKFLYRTHHDFLNTVNLSVFINAQFVDTPIYETAILNNDPLSDRNYNDGLDDSILEWQEGGLFQYDDKPHMFTFASPLTDREEVNVRITTSKLVDLYYSGSMFHIPNIFDTMNIYEHIRGYLHDVTMLYSMLGADQCALVDRFADFMIVIARECIIKTLNSVDEKEQNRVLEYSPLINRLVNIEANKGVFQAALDMMAGKPKLNTKWSGMLTLPEEFIHVRRQMEDLNKKADTSAPIGSAWGI